MTQFAPVLSPDRFSQTAAAIEETLPATYAFVQAHVPWNFTMEGVTVACVPRSAVWKHVYKSYYDTHDIPREPTTLTGWIRYGTERYAVPYATLAAFLKHTNTLIVVADGSDQNRAAMRQTLSHELVHVAQSQRRPFADAYQSLTADFVGTHAYDKNSQDVRNTPEFQRKAIAYQMLSEGHANWVQEQAFLTKTERTEVTYALPIRAYQLFNRIAKKIDPNRYRRAVRQRYLRGLQIVRTEHEAGGLESVDALYTYPPADLADYFEERYGPIL